jgi:hypothetical protein
MFTNDKLVYLQLHKTGCTHITALLKEHVGGSMDNKHSRYKQAKDDRLFIGSVRNPWAWYVSLWAYGCKGLGNIFNAVSRTRWQHLTRRAPISEGGWKSYYWRLLRAAQSGGRAGAWRSCYADANDPALFRKWLGLMYSHAGRRDLTEGFPYSTISQFAGILTYRYCDLYFAWSDWREQRHKVATLEELEALDARSCLIDYMIRTESLESDLLAALKLAGYRLDPETEQDIHGAAKSNTSSHRPYSEYYDDQSRQLVAQHESLIIAKHDYRFAT